MEPTSLRTPAEPGARVGSAAVPPPAKKQRTDDPTPLSEGAAAVGAAEAAVAATSGDGQELTRGNGAKMKKKRKTLGGVMKRIASSLSRVKDEAKEKAEHDCVPPLPAD